VDDLEMPLAHVIRRHVLAVLEKHGGNQKTAAESLCISVPKLRSYLASYGLVEAKDKAKPRTPAPEKLSNDDYAGLAAWCLGSEPWAYGPRMTKLVLECLDWHRAQGSLKADWVATCRTWIRNEAKRNPSLRSYAPPPAHKARAIEKASPGAKAKLDEIVSGLGRKWKA
jgi:hypothetical protein